jgi:hypothetical protein
MLTIWTEKVYLEVSRDYTSDKQPLRIIRDQFILHYIPLPLSAFFVGFPGGWSWGMFEWKCEIRSKDLYSKFSFQEGMVNVKEFNN